MMSASGAGKAIVTTLLISSNFPPAAASCLLWSAWRRKNTSPANRTSFTCASEPSASSRSSSTSDVSASSKAAYGFTHWHNWRVPCKKQLYSLFWIFWKTCLKFWKIQNFKKQGFKKQGFKTSNTFFCDHKPGFCKLSCLILTLRG